MKSSSCNIPSPADRIKFGFIFVVINSLFISFSSGLFGLKIFSIRGSCKVGIPSNCLFFSYSCGLFLIFAFVGGLLLFAVPILCNFKRLLLIACIFLDFSFLLFLLADSFVYPLYRTHLNLAMIQMTLLGGGRVVAFSSVMLSEIALMVLAVLIVSYFLQDSLLF